MGLAQRLTIVQRLSDDGVISPTERAGLIQNDKLTAAAKARVSKLMLGRFFGDPAQLDTIPPSIATKLERIAAPLVKLEDAGPYNLMPRIQEALDLIDEARAHGTRNLLEFLKQPGLIGAARYTEDAIGLAKMLQRMSGKGIANAVEEYAAAERNATEYHRAKSGLFGDQVTEPEPPGEAEAFAKAFRPGAKSTAEKIGGAIKDLAKDTRGSFGKLKKPTAGQGDMFPEEPLKPPMGAATAALDRALNPDKYKRLDAEAQAIAERMSAKEKKTAARNLAAQRPDPDFDKARAAALKGEADREYQARIDADRATALLKQKSARRVDAGKESIEDSPLFGGPRQGDMFSQTLSDQLLKD